MIFAQGNLKEDQLRMSLFQFQGGFLQPFGDMSELYGTYADVGFSFAYKSADNILLGADFLFLFGNKVKDENSLFGDLPTSSGNIIGIEGEFIRVLTLNRGFTGGFYVGKIFPIFGPNPNSGLEVRFGINYLEYRTWIETRQDDFAPLEGEYRKMYDRKRAGFATSQFVGYRHFSNNRFANFFLGFDFYQGFTTDYRDFDANTMQATNGDYLYFLVGFRFGWTIPVYRRAADKFYVD
jgi:hypothetical protein